MDFDLAVCMVLEPLAERGRSHSMCRYWWYLAGICSVRRSGPKIPSAGHIELGIGDPDDPARDMILVGDSLAVLETAFLDERMGDLSGRNFDSAGNHSMLVDMSFVAYCTEHCLQCQMIAVERSVLDHGKTGRKTVPGLTVAQTRSPQQGYCVYVELD
jgi:hypothetical protein